MVLFKRFVNKTTAKGNNNNNNNEGKKRNSVVTFNDETNVINHVELYENVEEIWYSKEDLAKFKHRDQYIVNKLTSKKKIDPTNCLSELRRMLLEESPRGLEYAAQPGKLKIQNKRRMNSIASVVNIQLVFQGLTTTTAEQDSSSTTTSTAGLCCCIDDLSDEIAKIYSARCETAIHEALEIASNDAQYVMNHIRTNTNIITTAKSSTTTTTTTTSDDEEEELHNSKSTNSNSSSNTHHHHHHHHHQKMAANTYPPEKKRRFFGGGATLLSRKERTRTHPNQ